MKLNQGERVRVDMTAPLSAMTFPFMELLVITGLAWIAIGFADQIPQTIPIDTQMRNAIVGLWAILGAWRFLLPLMRQRRQRFVVTDQRLLVRAEGLKARTDSIPMQQVIGAQKYKGGLSVEVAGMPQALYFRKTPRAKRVAQEINQQVVETRALTAAQYQHQYHAQYQRQF